LTEDQSDWSKFVYGEVKMRGGSGTNENLVSLEEVIITLITLTGD